MVFALLIMLSAALILTLFVVRHHHVRFHALNASYTRHLIKHAAELKKSVRLIENMDEEIQNLRGQLSDAHICIELALTDGLTPQSDLETLRSTIRKSLTPPKEVHSA